MSNYDNAKRHFQSETKDHQMFIIHEDGLYRHVRFKKPKTSAYHFDLVTYPGYLVFSGDMGTWVFSRLNDMFDFFNGDNINTGYWAEKLQHGAGGGRDIAKEYSQEETEKCLNGLFNDWVKENELTSDDGSTPEEIKQYKLEYEHHKSELNDLLRNSDEEYSMIEAIQNISNGGFDYSPFEETWDLICKDYSHHYLWACFAIQWGINKYKNNKVAIKAIDTFLSFK
ncbi:hypothetical protein J7S99_10625 [Providencia rettgeri]|uniref:hypothetical protein n=1 Tax=Providencia rettgeri TaxID=587 RepID=UPI001B374A74|nr:hypothetical protein [Providencia rettgeri]MBQ0398054.1 hypothetical protein [Providencia rettgeri]